MGQVSPWFLPQSKVCPLSPPAFVFNRRNILFLGYLIFFSILVNICSSVSKQEAGVPERPTCRPVQSQGRFPLAPAVLKLQPQVMIPRPGRRGETRGDWRCQAVLEMGGAQPLPRLSG